MNEGILLLFLSKRNGNSKEKEYLIENDKNGKDYEGIQTDDAPVKYLIVQHLMEKKLVKFFIL